MTLHAKFIKRTGGYSSQKGETIVELWNVQTDTRTVCDLGPRRVMAASGLPQRGAPYVPAGNCDESNADMVVDSVEVGDPREAGGVCGVDVTITYAEQKPTNQQRPIPNPQFNTDQDPLNWVPTVDVQIVENPAIAPKLYFLGAFQNDPARVEFNPCQTSPPAINLQAVANQLFNYTKDTWQPFANTAGDFFEPTAELESSDQIIVIKKNLATYDPDDKFACYSGLAVNNADVRVQFTNWGFNRVYKKSTLKVRHIAATPGYREWFNNSGAKQTRVYWETTFELQFRPRGWFVDRLNTGFNQIRVGVSQNLPDGNGGLMRYNDHKDGDSRIGPVRAQGEPISHAVHLNLEGRVLEAGQQPWTLRYLDGVYMSFTSGIAIPGVSAP